MMTKPRELGNLRLAKMARSCCGYREACAQIRSSRVRRHCENCRRPRLDWKRGTLFHASKTGIPRRTSRGFVGCIRSNASIKFRRIRALRNRGWLGTKNLHKAHVRGNGTNHQHRRRSGLDGCDRDVLPNGRWKDQTFSSSLVVRLRTVRGTDNEADMGTKRPRRTDTSAIIAETAAQANPVQTAPGLDRDNKRRERRGSADEWK